MMKQKKENHNGALEVASRLVDKLEALKPGQNFAELVRAAKDAIADARRGASSRVFPTELEPFGADIIQRFSFELELLSAPKLSDELAELHGRSLVSFPELANCLRSPMALAYVRESAAVMASRIARDPAELATEYVSHYESAIGAQLAAHQQFLPESNVLGTIIPDLERRVTTATQIREQASVDAREKAFQDELESLLEFFDDRGSKTVFATRWNSFNSTAYGGDFLAEELRKHPNPEQVSRARRLRTLCEVRDFFETCISRTFQVDGYNYYGAGIVTNLKNDSSDANVAKWRAVKKKYEAKERVTA